MWITTMGVLPPHHVEVGALPDDDEPSPPPSDEDQPPSLGEVADVLRRIIDADVVMFSVGAALGAAEDHARRLLARIEATTR